MWEYQLVAVHPYKDKDQLKTKAKDKVGKALRAKTFTAADSGTVLREDRLVEAL
jgi:hypothetical protein